MLQHGACHCLPGTPVTTRRQHPLRGCLPVSSRPKLFHNTDVTYFGTGGPAGGAGPVPHSRPATLPRVTSPPVTSAVPGLSVPGPPVTGPSVTGPPVRPERLDADEVRRLDVVRRFGTVGSLLMGVAALGVGTAPVLDNPVAGRPVLGLFIRM